MTTQSTEQPEVRNRIKPWVLALAFVVVAIFAAIGGMVIASSAGGNSTAAAATVDPASAGVDDVGLATVESQSLTGGLSPPETTIVPDPVTGEDMIVVVVPEETPIATTTSTTAAPPTEEEIQSALDELMNAWDGVVELSPPVFPGEAQRLTLPFFETFEVDGPIEATEIDVMVVIEGWKQASEDPTDRIFAEIRYPFKVPITVKTVELPCGVDEDCVTKTVVAGTSLLPDLKAWTYQISFPKSSIALGEATSLGGLRFGHDRAMDTNDPDWGLSINDPAVGEGFVNALDPHLMVVAPDENGQMVTQLAPELWSPMYGAVLSFESCWAELHGDLFSRIADGVQTQLDAQGFVLGEDVYLYDAEGVAESIAEEAAKPEYNQLGNVTVFEWTGWQVVSVSLDGEVCGGQTG